MIDGDYYYYLFFVFGNLLTGFNLYYYSNKKYFTNCVLVDSTQQLYKYRTYLGS